MTLPQRVNTPPGIVARSASPERALAAFIGQELEHWGFTVTSVPTGLRVECNDRRVGDIYVQITEGMAR